MRQGKENFFVLKSYDFTLQTPPERRRRGVFTTLSFLTFTDEESAGIIYRQ